METRGAGKSQNESSTGSSPKAKIAIFEFHPRAVVGIMKRWPYNRNRGPRAAAERPRLRCRSSVTMNKHCALVDPSSKFKTFRRDYVDIWKSYPLLESVIRGRLFGYRGARTTSARDRYHRRGLSPGEHQSNRPAADGEH